MKTMIESIRRNPFAPILLVFALVLPLFLKNQYILSIIVQIFIFAAMSSSWNIIGGFGRQISWAHASFFAIGAYTSMLLFLRVGLIPWVSLFIGMAFSAVFAVIMGFPSFRLRGTYFALATIACGQIVKEMLIYFNDFTGGAEGLVIGSKFRGLLVLRWRDEVPYYYLFLALLLVILAVVAIVERGRLGYFLKAIREDQDAAESLGIRSSRVKMIAFIISAMCISVVGSFYGFKMAYIDPTMVGSFDLAIRIGVIAIIGGVGTFWGPLLGAVIIIPLMEATNALLPPELGGASLAIYGLILMLIVIFKPEGVWSVVSSGYRKMTAKRPAK